MIRTPAANAERLVPKMTTLPPGENAVWYEHPDYPHTWEYLDDFKRQDHIRFHGHTFWLLGLDRAVRAGNWKLVSRHPGKWELYDMNDDRTELIDLAAKNAPKVEELASLYDGWAQRCGVLPWDQVQKRD